MTPGAIDAAAEQRRDARHPRAGPHASRRVDRSSRRCSRSAVVGTGSDGRALAPPCFDSSARRSFRFIRLPSRESIFLRAEQRSSTTSAARFGEQPRVSSDGEDRPDARGAAVAALATARRGRGMLDDLLRADRRAARRARRRRDSCRRDTRSDGSPARRARRPPARPSKLRAAPRPSVPTVADQVASESPTARPEVPPLGHGEQRRDVVHRVGRAEEAVERLPAIGTRGEQRVRVRLPPHRGRVHLLVGQVDVAVADVLVGVVADLLVARNAAHQMHLAVVAQVRRRRSRASSKHVEHLELGVVDGVGVVVGVGLRDERLAPVPVQPLDLPRAAPGPGRSRLRRV